MKNDLISRDALVKFIGEGLNSQTFGHEAIEILTEIIFAPAADAVQVVRCKGCKHMEVFAGNLRFCNVWQNVNGMGDDGYCNYGERRSDSE